MAITSTLTGVGLSDVNIPLCVINQSAVPVPSVLPALQLPVADANGLNDLAVWEDPRASTINATDFEGLLKEIPLYIPAQSAGRVVRNLANFTDSPSTQSISVVSGSDYQVSIGAGSAVGSTAVCSGAFTGTLTGTGTSRISFPNGTAKTAVSGTLTVTITGAVTDLQVEPVDGQAVSAPSEYVPVLGAGFGDDVKLLYTGQQLGSGWSWINPGTDIQVTSAINGSQTIVYFGSGLVLGRGYEITVRIYNHVAGTLTCNFASSGSSLDGVLTNIGSADGTYTVSGPCDVRSATKGIVYRASGTCTMDFEIVSMRESGNGIAYFSRQNNNSVNGSGVVTESVGSVISPAPRFQNWPQSTNYADTDDDLSGGAETVDLTASGTGDYTLSVAGTAAVTVAAGTATGTGFGQATDGSPVTFNLSAAGTVTLTLDSGTLDTFEGAAIKQVEKQSAVTPFIKSPGGGAVRFDTLMRYPFSTAVFNQAEGAVVIRLTPNQAQTVLTATDEGGVSVADAAANVFYMDSGGYKSTDGPNTAVVDPSFVAGTAIYCAVRWNATDGIRIGWKTSGTWTWDTSSAPYDGSFTSGSWLNLFYANSLGIDINDFYTYLEDPGEDWIEGNF